MRTFAALGILMTTLLLAGDGIHNFTMQSIDGADLPLAGYKGKVVVVVNTASQ